MNIEVMILVQFRMCENIQNNPMTHQWDERYICLHEWLIFMVNVGKYTSPMEPLGINALFSDDIRYFHSLIKDIQGNQVYRIFAYLHG